LGLEKDGLDQNDAEESDEGLNGLDDDGVRGVDDYDTTAEDNERETRPPYAVPLTGIEVKIRTIEFGTRQVRQVSVVGDFTD
jgi:hypothetical protein